MQQQMLLLIMHSLTPTQYILNVLTPMKHLQKIELVDKDNQAPHHLTPPLKELVDTAQTVLRGGSQDAGYPDRHVSVRFAQDSDLVRFFLSKLFVLPRDVCYLSSESVTSAQS